MKVLLCFYIIAFSTQLFSQRPIVSAIRGDNESFQMAYARNVRQHSRSFRQTRKVTDFATGLGKLKISQIPNLTKEQHLKAIELFKTARDRRLIKDDQGQSRRLPWLYPKDGCFDRADAVKNIFTRAKIPINKVFVFGNLRARSNFMPRRYVSWWYHVAIGYRVNKQVYIIDPALDPYKPLKLNNWIGLQSNQIDKVQVAICHKDSVTPSSKCGKPRVQGGEQLKASLRRFLNLEKQSLRKLGYNTAKELGPYPYWKRKKGLILPKELANFFKLLESFQ